MPDDEVKIRRRGRVGKRRLLFTCAKAAATLVTLTIVAAGILVVRMSAGPIPIEGLGTTISNALEDRFGHGLTFSIGGTSLVQHGFGPSLAINGLTVAGPDHQAIVTAPKAEIAVDMIALFFGKVVPKRLEVFDVTLYADLMKSGMLAIGAGDGAKPFIELGRGDEAAPEPGLAPDQPSAGPRIGAALRRDASMRMAAAGIRQTLDVLTDPRSPIAAVDRLAISRGRLVIRDQENGEEVVYRDLDLAFDKKRGVTTFELAAQGPSRRWTLNAFANGRPGTDRHFKVDIKDLSSDELQLIAASRSLGFDTDMAFGFHLELDLDAANALSRASGGFDIGDGFIRFDDPDFEPTFIKAFKGDFRWNGPARRIDVGPMRYAEGGTRLDFSGSVLPPVNEGDPWTMRLGLAEPGVLGPDRKGQASVPILDGGLAARFVPDDKRVIIDRLFFKADRGGMALAGQVDWQNGPHLRIGASMDPTPVQVVERVWPSSIAASVRAWILTHFESGTISNGTMKIDYDSDDLKRMRADHAPRDTAVAIDFKVDEGRVSYLDGVPPLDGIAGTAHITGRTSRFLVDKAFSDAGGKTLTLTDGSLVVGNTDKHPASARIAAHVSGSVEAVANLLTLDALKPYASLPLDPATLHGQVDGNLVKDLSLGDGAKPDGPLSVQAEVSQFTAERLIGKESLQEASLNVSVADGKLKATGQGQIFGGAATFEIDRDGFAPPAAQIALTLDDAARAKLGMAAIEGVSGPMTAHINAVLGDPAKMKAQVEVDLAKTAIDSGILGLSKPSGRPAKVAFTIAAGDHGLAIEPMTIDIASLQARGGLELNADNSFRSARFGSLKVSPGDDMKLDVTKADDIFKLTIRGSTIDARPFLKALTSSPSGDPTPLAKSNREKKDADTPKGFDVDMKSAILTGFNKEAMTGAELKLSKRGGDIRQFAVQGRFGRAAVSGQMAPGGRIKVQAQDAGSLVSFIDLYKHMEGGQLTATMQMSDQTLSGLLEIHDFVLRDEPAIRRLVATTTEVSAPGQNAAAARQINAGAVDFKRLKVNFDRAGSRLELRDATMYGPQIGLSVDGWLDYSHDRVGMKGTFVPVFALNNLFSQIPVLGAFLGGKSNEGLLAITFNISGQASSPSLTINPLSAIAPGFLRNIFGVLDNPMPQPDGSQGNAFPSR